MMMEVENLLPGGPAHWNTRKERLKNQLKNLLEVFTFSSLKHSGHV